MSEFELGVDACVVVRRGQVSFDVFPSSGGSHLLELFDPDIFGNGVEAVPGCFLDGRELLTDGMLGIWDLLELPPGGSRVYEAEDVLEPEYLRWCAANSHDPSDPGIRNWWNRS